MTSGQIFQRVLDWIGSNVLTLDVALQLILVLLAYGLAWRLGHRLDRENRLEKWVADHTNEEDPWLRRIGHTADNLIVPIFWLAFLWGLSFALSVLKLPTDFIRITASLLNAWVLIHLVSSFAASIFWQKAFAMLAWTIAALYVLDLLVPAQQLLDSYGFALGKARLSPYIILKGILIATVLLAGWCGFQNPQNAA